MSSKAINYINNFISKCQDEDFVALWENEEKDKVYEMIKSLENKSFKKKPKDKSAPKKNLSTWILYSKVERSKVKIEFPNMPPKEVMSELARRWKIVKEDEDVMGEFKILAEEDKKRYDEEKKNYVPKDIENSEKDVNVKKKKTKVAGQPKNPRSGWLFFCEEERKNIKNEEDAPKGKDILPEIASRWKVLKEKGGKKYTKFDDMANKDKYRYKEEMNKWNQDKSDEDEPNDKPNDKPNDVEQQSENEDVDEDVDVDVDEKPLPKKKAKKGKERQKRKNQIS